MGRCGRWISLLMVGCWFPARKMVLCAYGMCNRGVNFRSLTIASRSTAWYLEPMDCLPIARKMARCASGARRSSKPEKSRAIMASQGRAYDFCRPQGEDKATGRGQAIAPTMDDLSLGRVEP